MEHFCFRAFNRLPFHWDNPAGYLFAFALECIIFGYETFVIACILAFGIGACCFVISSIREIQSILYLINEKALANDKHSNEIRASFSAVSEFIDAYGALKQFSRFQFLSIKNCTNSKLSPVIDSISDWCMIFRTSFSPCSCRVLRGAFLQFLVRC